MCNGNNRGTGNDVFGMTEETPENLVRISCSKYLCSSSNIIIISKYRRMR